MPHEREQINTMLKRELGFNEGQIGKYLILRQLHREQISNLDNEIRDLKRQMFDEVLQNNSPPTLSDSLLSITLEKQGQIELLTYQHLLDLKKLCGPEQQDKLQMLLHELFRSKSAGEGPNPPPPHLGEEQRQKHQGGFLPPPPPGERPQIHPPRNQ
ncbi:MAG: hypothetical protein HQ509_00540 [Candidatus Marinimicrobia bacterium]|nr:hypothetical protein [Candidatus Neomarinimicrobiota bacterium]